MREDLPWGEAQQILDQYALSHAWEIQEAIELRDQIAVIGHLTWFCSDGILYVFYLSLGQKKRVRIADVMIIRPHLLLLDEPAAYLDPKPMAS